MSCCTEPPVSQATVSALMRALSHVGVAQALAEAVHAKQAPMQHALADTRKKKNYVEFWSMIPIKDPFRLVLSRCATACSTRARSCTTASCSRPCALPVPAWPTCHAPRLQLQDARTCCCIATQGKVLRHCAAAAG